MGKWRTTISISDIETAGRQLTKEFYANQRQHYNSLLGVAKNIARFDQHAQAYLERIKSARDSQQVNDLLAHFKGERIWMEQLAIYANELGNEGLGRIRDVISKYDQKVEDCLFERNLRDQVKTSGRVLTNKDLARLGEDAPCV